MISENGGIMRFLTHGRVPPESENVVKTVTGAQAVPPQAILRSESSAVAQCCVTCWCPESKIR